LAKIYEEIDHSGRQDTNIVELQKIQEELEVANSDLIRRLEISEN
jgi:hypothetical protein